MVHLTGFLVDIFSNHHCLIISRGVKSLDEVNDTMNRKFNSRLKYSILLLAANLDLGEVKK